MPRHVGPVGHVGCRGCGCHAMPCLIILNSVISDPASCIPPRRRGVPERRPRNVNSGMKF
eukprot:8061490-Pyramimonas_sp.AAC.1